VKAVEDFTGSDRLTTVEHYVAAASKDGALYDAIETLLKGPEISLPDHGMLPYWDHEADLERKKARIRWWDHDAAALPHLAELSGAKLKNRDRYPAYAPGEVKTVDPQFLSYVYKDHVPLFYGHYWRRWENHRDEWTTYTACVDFSAVRGGALVAYRWNGEPEIHWRNYIPHDPAVVAPAPSDQTV
jgi:hypothetical protein